MIKIEMSSEQIHQTKQELRRCMISKILALSETQKAEWSQSIVNTLKVSDFGLPAKGAVAMFGGSKLEPDLLALIPWLDERGVCVSFFGMQEGGMHPYRIYTMDDLSVGRLGVLEPACHPERRMALADITVILTPGLAFEARHGHRMGRGAGYYDRFFNNPQCQARRVGVGFSCQFGEVIPVEEHDVPMQAFVTEEGWFDVAPS